MMSLIIVVVVGRHPHTDAPGATTNVRHEVVEVHGILVKIQGKKFLLGTQKPEEAKQAIAQFLAFKSASPESEKE